MKVIRHMGRGKREERRGGGGGKERGGGEKEKEGSSRLQAHVINKEFNLKMQLWFTRARGLFLVFRK